MSLPQYHTDQESPPAYSFDRPHESSVQPSSLPPVQPLLHPTTTSSSQTLLRPIAIPATSPKLGSPFLRAYPPSLESFDLPRELFLRFLDDLNRVAVASPPLQVLGLAGGAVGFVPLQTAQIVSGAVQAATTIGTIALSKGRTELCLRQANQEIFGPRGLKVEIAKIDALAKVAGMPILNAEGKLEKNASLLAPIDDLEASLLVTGQDRRLAALEPWIAHLDLSPLPDIGPSSNPLSKLSVAASERMRKKGEKDMLKNRASAHKDHSKESAKAKKDYDKEMTKLEKKSNKAQRESSAGKVEKELAKIEKEKTKVEREYENEMGKIEKDRLKDDKEEKGMRKILWLIIRNADADSGAGPL